MADAAVEFLLDNLTQLLLHQIKLIKNSGEKVEEVKRNLSFFKSFLKKVSSRKQRKDEMLEAVVRDIRSAVYDAEDTIDAVVAQAAEKKTASYFSNFKSLITIANDVDSICKRINEIYGNTDKLDLFNLPVAGGAAEVPLQPTSSRKDNVVGLHDETETIKEYLNESTGYLDVISIIGMPGLGKTTLAGKIFHDQDTKFEFPTRLWVYVSQEFIEKEVFLAILRQLSKLNEEEYNKKSVAQLADEIATKL